MNPLKKAITTAAALAFFGATASFATSTKLLEFTFDTPTPTTVAGIDDTVSWSTGDTATGALVINVPQTPGSISTSFDFKIDPSYIVDIEKVSFDSSSLGLTFWVLNHSEVIGQYGFGLSGNTSPDEINTPIITGLTGTTTFRFDLTSVFGTSPWTMDNFAIYGSLSAVPETSTLLLGSAATIFALGLGIRRRRQPIA